MQKCNYFCVWLSSYVTQQVQNKSWLQDLFWTTPENCCSQGWSSTLTDGGSLVLRNVGCAVNLQSAHIREYDSHLGPRLGTSRLEILPVPWQYIFSLMNFLVNNEEHFQTTSSRHIINRWNWYLPHRPDANLSCFQIMYISSWHQNFQQFYHVVWKTLRMERQNLK